MTRINARHSYTTIALIAGIIILNSCTGNSSNDSSAVSSVTDSSVTAADTSATKPIARKKKGIASVIINKDNGMKVEKDKEGVYSNAEVMPEYPGGEAALSAFVENKINYPQNAIDANTEGTVNISFVIDEKGKVTKPMTTGNTAGNGLDEEALKIVNQLPSWKPGTVKGKPVKTRLTLPITFKLADI